MCRTSGWRHVKESTEKRMLAIASSLANGVPATYDDVLKLQGEYKALKYILNNFDITEN
jgi:hypothetical protein